MLNQKHANVFQCKIFLFGLASRSHLKCLAFYMKNGKQKVHEDTQTGKTNEKIFPTTKSRQRNYPQGSCYCFILSSFSSSSLRGDSPMFLMDENKERILVSCCRVNPKKEEKLPVWEKWSEEQAENITNRTRLFKKPNNGFFSFFSPVMWRYIGSSQFFFVVVWDVLSEI